jgi:hypothetical protein
MGESKYHSVAFSPQWNYTDWATATDQGILLPDFVEGCGVVSAAEIPRPLFTVL